MRAKREKAEQQIAELKELRQELVFQHLKKMYSDEVYQEQEKAIKTKLVAAETVLGKAIFDHYNISDVEQFMRDKFSDLGKTYVESEPGQRRVLLGSICPAGLSWTDFGLSNHEFSQQYQAILNADDPNFALSTPGGNRTPNQVLRTHLLCPLSYGRKNTPLL